MKENLCDLTFIIPIRLDSLIRLENLLLVIDFLNKSFITNIIVLEAASYNNEILSKIIGRKAKYIFVKDKDSVFYRTKYLNQMSHLVSTPFIGIWDADIIVDKAQILDCMEHLRKQDFDIAFPYDGKCLDTTLTIRDYYFQNRKPSILGHHKAKMNLLYGANMFGGAILVNKERYKASGYENENYYGWGPEDAERYHRWKSLKYNIYRAKGCAYHLTHPRDLNGRLRSNDHAQRMIGEVLDTIASSPEEILNKFRKTHIESKI